jgi:hypothetical protein
MEDATIVNRKEEIQNGLAQRRVSHGWASPKDLSMRRSEETID